MPMLTGNLLSKGLKNDGTVNSYLGHKKEARSKLLNLLLVLTSFFSPFEKKEKKKKNLPRPLAVLSLQIIGFQVENPRETCFRRLVQQ